MGGLYLAHPSHVIPEILPLLAASADPCLPFPFWQFAQGGKKGSCCHSPRGGRPASLPGMERPLQQQAKGCPGTESCRKCEGSSSTSQQAERGAGQVKKYPGEVHQAPKQASGFSQCSYREIRAPQHRVSSSPRAGAESRALPTPRFCKTS